ncbi:MAG: peptidoglycan DD-metalloendopeptidase family protein [Minisyncoccia bacterium]
MEKQKILPPYLGEIFVIFVAIFWIVNDNYLNKTVIFLKQNGYQERIKETSQVAFLKNSSSKIAYAFFESVAVDGEQIDLDQLKQNNSEEQNYYFLVESSVLYANNSPFGFYLPTASRHGVITYLVKEGDSLGKIAANFGISLNTLIWANNLKSNSIIKAGQELVVLPVSGVLHTVKKGDTLSLIAKKYKVDAEAIIAFNNLDEKKDLIINQKIIIPNGVLSSNANYSNTLPGGLKPMTEDTSSWPEYKNYYAYPTSGGWNKGILHYYNAVDIINSCGSPIYAAAEGIVTESKGNGQYNLGYGNLIKIQHYNGTMTVYGHLSEVLVQEGEKVSQGQLIGRMGNTGNSNGCHLHFEVRGAKNPFVIR